MCLLPGNEAMRVRPTDKCVTWVYTSYGLLAIISYD
eukprot:UN12283